MQPPPLGHERLGERDRALAGRGEHVDRRTWSQHLAHPRERGPEELPEPGGLVAGDPERPLGLADVAHPVGGIGNEEIRRRTAHQASEIRA